MIAIKVVVVRDVQQSVVRHTTEALLTLNIISALMLSYGGGNKLSDSLFLFGKMFDGSRAFTKLLNPLSSTIEKGCKSRALCSVCLMGPIGAVTYLVI